MCNYKFDCYSVFKGFSDEIGSVGKYQFLKKILFI